MYSQLFLNQSNIKNKQEFLPGSKNHISCNALLSLLFISQIMQPCSAEMGIADAYSVFLSDIFKNRLCTILKMNDRTYKRVLKELTDAHLLHLINKKEQSYYVNPFMFSNSGSLELVQRSKLYFADNNIFYPLELDDDIRNGNLSLNDKNTFDRIYKNITEKSSRFCQIYLTMDNFIYYSALLNGKINYTELVIFLILANKASYVNTPSSPEMCNRISLNGKDIKKIADDLKIGKSTLCRTISNLCKYHFLHKLSGLNGEYIINPFLSAKGEMSKVAKLRDKILLKFFDGLADGDAQMKTDSQDFSTRIFSKETGEVLEIYVA